MLVAWAVLQVRLALLVLLLTQSVVLRAQPVLRELRVRRVALRARLEVDVAGTVVRGTYRYTRVWAREAGSGWRVVGGHVAAVP